MLKSKGFTLIASIIVISAQVFAVPLAIAGDINEVFDRSSRVMLYANLPFGEHKQRQTAPQLGLRFERPVASHSYGPIRAYSTQNFRPLAEFRLTSGYGYSLRFADSPVYDSKLGFGESSSESSIESSVVGSLQNRAARAALIFLLGAAVLCVAETVICEDDDGYQPPADTGPGTGG